MSIERVKKLFYLSKRLYGKHSLQVFVLIGLSVSSGFVGSLGISALIPLFSYVVNGRIEGDNPISKGFNAIFQYLGFHPSLKVLLITVAFLFVLKAIILAVFSYIKMTLSASYELYIRSSLYNKVLKSDWSYLSSQKLGYLHDTLMSDASSLGSFLKELSNFALNFSSFLIYAATAFSIAPFIASASLGFGLSSVLLIRPFLARLRAVGQEGIRAKKEIAHRINENILGAKAIKAMNVEVALSESINKLFEILRDLSFKFRKVRIVIEDPIEPLSMVFITILFAISFLRPGFELSVFLVTIYLVKNILGYVDRMRNSILKVNDMIPNIQRVIRLQGELDKFQEEDRGSLEFKFEKEFVMKAVNFAYNKKNGSVLENINLNIKRGETVGIIGASGAGKSTLADLILRLFSPTSGEIFIDGENIQNIKLESWRKNIGYVMQDIFLKNDDIENNIRFYDQNIADADITEAAKMAQCADFINALPKGFKTKIGERGMSLSGGQRQRIALARALARRPQILILDEATSSVDNQSEILIKKAIETLHGKMTIIIIAHRLSTILDADKLIYLDKGMVVEKGKPKQLLQNPDSHFSRMYNAKA